MATKRKGNKICPAGIAWARRTFDKYPDRCLPMAKAKSLSKSERAATARKKKAGGAKGKQFVKNTPKARVSYAKKKRKSN